MIDFVEYVVSELKSARLSRQNAVHLLRQFSSKNTLSQQPAALHPLLHQNVSDIYQQRYYSTFNEEAFFLRDHEVIIDEDHAYKVLPGVVYLEIARAAVANALRLEEGEQLCIKDVVWLKPIVISEPKDIWIDLYPTDAGGHDDIEFVIYTVAQAADGQPDEVTHCRGFVCQVRLDDPPPVDIAALKKEMTAGQLDAAVIYPAYLRMGMKFGPAHQAVASVFRGKDGVVAELVLPDVVRASFSEYLLHPSLLDGALQASIGLLEGVDALPERPSLPFALNRLNVYRPCSPEMTVWIRRVCPEGADAGVVRLDIDLYNAQGLLCVQLSGFTSRELRAERAVPQAEVTEDTGLVLGCPVWRDEPLATSLPVSARARHILLCGFDFSAQEMAHLQQRLPNGQFYALASTANGVAEYFTAMARDSFDVIRDIVRGATTGETGIQIAVADDSDAALLLALSGLLKSASWENPAIHGQMLQLARSVTADELAQRLQNEAGDPETQVRYLGARRQTLAWQPLPAADGLPGTLFKENGVYLITGGLGALGLLFAGEILRQTTAARVILTGRAPPSSAIERKLRVLGSERVDYLALEVTDADATQQALASVFHAHGQLNGILHAAGMVADNFIVRKETAEFEQVLAPKVAGTVNLDFASREYDLDFFVLFSSGASVLGNVGQADYAVANGFMDRFVHYRNARVAEGARKGKTLAIGWPLWQEGGMQMPEQRQASLYQVTGMLPMRTASGMTAFYRSLACSCAQTLVVEGHKDRLRRSVFGHTDAPDAPRVAALAHGHAPEDLAEQTLSYLRKQVATLFKLPYEKVDPRVSLEKYGIDSILAMDLTLQMEKTFGPLSKTLFFEHQSLSELRDYFLDAHRTTLEQLFTGRAPDTAPLERAPVQPAARRVPRNNARRAPQPGQADNEPIAIVGLSGRYPEAVDLNAFWRNLCEGKDCIREVPASRWDWRDYYSADRHAEGAHYSKWGGFIEGVDEFDPLFFAIPPVDAPFIDPQERLFLQHAWMAIEDAGYTRAGLQGETEDGLAGQVGVYAGVMYGEYQLFGAEASLRGQRMGIPGSYASVANRVSYFLNLHGPSMTVDTMCSSSLTAIHLACQDLKHRRTHLALAGGVNVTLHPNKYLILSAGQYISGEGRCQSFGEGGDGYIPGEGVGVAVLKRLADAERDGNHIYGVIRASALNHGGKTNGYSVPNPKAQSAVILRALKESGVDARQVSYIEAHGTGTRLGDPIEIAALTQTFRKQTAERQFCALGSAKSNIGHCESAAGIAGLTKVLLQMRHGKLVPSLHSSTLNPHIDFTASPFFVNQTLTPWQRPEIDGKLVPRIAGLSSFGAGGANAHLIIEEYPERTPTAAADVVRVIVPLSARTHEQLRQKAQGLLAFLAQDPASGLAAIAFTLQTGREEMDYRLAMVVDSAEQLQEKLSAFCRDEQQDEACFYARVDDDNGMAVFSQDDDMREGVARWIARNKLHKLAELWVKGLEFDWHALYGEAKPARASLPTYPFARERYWVPTRPAARAVASAQVIHPLLHRNTSDFYQQSYTTTFSGQEYFLADHQVSINGQRCKTLPGVACLEMVRAAVTQAFAQHDDMVQLVLRNVVWPQPLTVETTQQVVVTLVAQGDSGVDFTLHSVAQEAGGEAALYCQGRAEMLAAPSPQAWSLDALKQQMCRDVLAPEQLYHAFSSLGMHYGPAMQSVNILLRGDGQLLAELQAPGNSAEGFAFAPSLLDGALQACAGLENVTEGLSQAVPFALDSVELLAPCAAPAFAWVRYATDGRPMQGRQKIDIDLYGPDGVLCARLAGLTLRASDGEGYSALLLARADWALLAQAHLSASPAAEKLHQRVLVCNMPQVDVARLAARLPGTEAVHLSGGEQNDIAARYHDAAQTCLAELQTLFSQNQQENISLHIVLRNEGEEALLAGLTGLMACARRENPAFVGQVIFIDPGSDADALADCLLHARRHHNEPLLNYARGQALAWRWQPYVSAGQPAGALRARGLYLITGGLGGLGKVFARDILTRGQDTRVILTGRGEPDAQKRAWLDAWCEEFAVSQNRLVYRALDVSERAQTAAALEAMIEEFGALHGVIHAAGMTRDSFIIHKTPQALSAVLAPKVAGTLNLDWATRHLALDFMVLFSSLASALGNVGQADYAAANGFMDCFAGYRNRLAAAGERQGKTISINWPLWHDGGMQIDEQTRDMLMAASGMDVLTTENGLRAFYQALALEGGQYLVVQGQTERLKALLLPAGAPPAAPEPQGSVAEVPQDTLLPLALRYLREQFSALLQIAVADIDVKAPLERYGIDSVLAMKLTTQLEKTFGSLSKTLFFEYQTLSALAAYLARAFPAVIRQMDTAAAPGAAAALRREPLNHKALPVLPVSKVAVPPAAHNDDVAIVGVAGRYPGADDLETFWHNLQNGRDCISEIPPTRWRHAPFYHPERGQAGKTYSKWGGFLSDVDRFDALFFNISPKEAELMDPQERLFLETVWEAIEDAGYSKDAMAERRVGVYVGVMWGQYQLYGGTGGVHGIPGSSFASIANRVSYFFNFHGPSLALDTMCSSSMTAIHLACEEIRRGTIDSAVAGGVNVSIHPNKYLSLSQGNFLSSDGRCRSFGAGGDGYVPGEGVGAVLLKSLTRARQDGDNIYAVIKGGAINHGGKTNGYTVPNPLAQGDLIVDAFTRAQIAPQTIGYIEAHGTGTSLGDPVEINGLLRAFGGGDVPAAPVTGATCPIGSVKSNIGHLESAAGIAAVTKVLLQLKHRQWVPSLHAQTPNAHIHFAQTPFRLQTALEDWPQPAGYPRRAGISSFGAGGANAHLILEEFTPPPQGVPETRMHAFVLSAKNRATLRASAERLVAFLHKTDEAPLGDIAFTLQVGRTAMPARLAVLAEDSITLCARLQSWLAADLQQVGGQVEGIYEGVDKPSRTANTDDDEQSAQAQRALARRDLEALAALWVSGIEVNWPGLYQPGDARRVSLPTYPFTRERYWLAPADAAPAIAAEQQLLYYRYEWQQAQALAACDGLPGGLLVLGAGDEQTAALVRCNSGVTMSVEYGKRYEALGARTYRINPHSEQDFAALAAALQANGGIPQTVIHFASGSDDTQRQLTHSVYALHSLYQALMKHKTGGSIRFLTCYQAQNASDALFASSLAGYFSSLALENPAFSWKVIATEDAATGDTLAAHLLNEAADSTCSGSEIRYLQARSQGEASWPRQISTLRGYVPDETPGAPVPVKQNGVYLITGGMGGLGYLFARYLTQHYRATLVLTGRSALDAAQQQQLEALGAGGNTVVYLQADIADYAQTDALMAESRRRFGAINGVIHCAGVSRDAFARNKTKAEMATVFAVKVQGTLNLDRATRDDSLDIFVMFSSIAGITGNLGQCDYAFANRFQAAFAGQRQHQVALRERNGKTLAIAWPYWQEGGMQISESDLALMFEQSGILPLPTPEGFRAWETLLRGDEALGVTLYGVPASINAYLAQRASVRDSVTCPTRQDNAPAEASSLRAATEGYLRTLLGEEIKLAAERIDTQERFDAYGLDSVMIGRLNVRLASDLKALSKTLFYEYATIDELAAYLLQEAGNELASLLAVSGASGDAAPARLAGERPLQNDVARLTCSVQARETADGAVAIIGVHGRFPQAETAEEYWQLLRAGKTCIERVPPARWDYREYLDADLSTIYCPWGSFLQDVENFDAEFFGIAQEEARTIDPQERLFLQSVWAALEDAGYTRESLKKRFPKGKSASVGVFVGMTTNTYPLLSEGSGKREDEAALSALPWSLANRVSYFFDFQGPSMPVDTACSSSLTAIHLACESLRRHECQVAIAGGVNLYLHPAKYQALCRKHMLSTDDSCHSYGAGGEGFIPGEGVSSVVLKPLALAIEDGDPIYGVIAASANEHSGRSNGYTAPNPSAQAITVEQLLREANVDPETIGYVEGHGTGTALGDNLEVAALSQAFRRFTPRRQFCSLGSVKANMGHAESAAGMAGLVKILMQFRHRALAPALYAQNANPDIDFASSPFYLQPQASAWDVQPGQPRRALLNAFGAGGVSACLLLEEFIAPPASANVQVTQAPSLIILSARNAWSLRESARRLHDYLQREPGVALANLAYTLQVGREEMAVRLAVVAISVTQMAEALSAYLTGQPAPRLLEGDVSHRATKKATAEQRAQVNALFSGGEAGLNALAKLWLDGAQIDWDSLGHDGALRRLSLPGYVFLPTPHPSGYWPVSAVRDTSLAQVACLHPLLSHNASTLREFAFNSTLTAQAYYARDHQINGEPFFPGSGFLEVACISGAIAGERPVTCLEDIVWVQPLKLTTQACQLKTVMTAQGDEVEFAMVSCDDDSQRLTHAQGRIGYCTDTRHDAPVRDIPALLNAATRVMTREDCYRQFSRMGLEYGPGFQSIQTLHAGEDFALAWLNLADALKEDFEQYILHPALIDGALQTVAGMMLTTQEVTPYLPFALERVVIVRPLVENCYALAKQTPSSSADLLQFDIHILNEKGEMLVMLERFYVRALVGG